MDPVDRLCDRFEAAWWSGQRPRLEDYVQRFPDLGPLQQVPDNLIAYEYRVRHRWGDKPTHNDYLQRFGSRRAGLVILLKEADREWDPRRKGPSESSEASGSQQESGALRIRCPHCRSSIDISEDR